MIYYSPLLTTSTARWKQLALSKKVTLACVLFFSVFLLSEVFLERGISTRIASHFSPVPEKPLSCANPFEFDHHGPRPTYPRKANATFLTLARNSDIAGVIHSMKQVEGRFNRDRHYPWVFLNDKPFSEEFIACTTAATSSKTYYGQIPPEQWVQPDFIDEAKATMARKALSKIRGVYYAGEQNLSVMTFCSLLNMNQTAYRNMCRFYSGSFYKQPLLQNYKYYWRVEPDINYRCEIEYDPFLYMEDNNKAYGFTISVPEQKETTPTLWETSMEFFNKNPQYLHPNNAMRFASKDGGKTWTRCTYWTNFEIGDLDFFRESEGYNKYFEALEAAGGFYYERWGDAPYRGIALSLLLDRNRIHHFDDFAYEHTAWEQCPNPSTPAYERGRCSCDYDQSMAVKWERYSCQADFDAVFAAPGTA
ncbi:nucleotide-diphospho-sugar transferase [Rhodocollybia butyracea]|uniref:Nucleotide-diphospho-sugar transferase n=1 Tax=Rhodocollybia butyracea TaxID=206335 RepID=A0A9P5UFJ2_9AGAR|nr:nucleotide-diphospho-sugar transferase [Rhodocollybia butyracea]